MNLSVKLETSITDDEGIPNYDNYLKTYNLQKFLEKNVHVQTAKEKKMFLVIFIRVALTR